MQNAPGTKRPESYSPINYDITLLNHLGTKNAWATRKDFVLKNNIIHTNLASLIKKARNNELSLAIFRPKEIVDFLIKETDREYDEKKLEEIKIRNKQISLFPQSKGECKKEGFKFMPKLPYKFSYRLIDDEGKESTMMIEDWEVGQLYWNCLKNSNEEELSRILKKR